MGEGRAKAQALLLAALLLRMSCSATASPYNCIPRRLLMESGPYYQRPPCNDDDPIDRRATPSGSDDGPRANARGQRTWRWGPPPPMSGTARARAAKPHPATPPGSIN